MVKILAWSLKFPERVAPAAKTPDDADTYRVLSNARVGFLHLTDAEAVWLAPGRNPFGLYLYTDDVDGLASRFGSEILGIGRPEDKPWGMYEFAVSDPDQALVRIGWPSRLRSRS